MGPFPHDPIREVAQDIFFIGATFQMNALMRISRNMVVVRSGDELTLVNPIRLTPDGEAALEALGTVKHAVRLGSLHGCDDVYIKDRFGAEFWYQENSDYYPEPKADHRLAADSPLPIPDAELLEFTAIKRPECVMLIKRGDGMLLTCDSLQNYATFERHSIVAKLIMPAIGFRRRMMVGPIWLKLLTKKGQTARPDFERLLALEFDSLISAHGLPMLGGAKAAVQLAVDQAKFDVM